MNKIADAPSNKPINNRKRILFRCASVLFAIALIAVAESFLRFAGIGVPQDLGGPYVGFHEIHPLFEINEDKTRYEIPESRRRFFRPESFAAQKDKKEFRIFCLGGSTVQGRPYAIETSFTSWLELSLKAAHPERTWESVNCGGVSYASYRLVPILKEILNYSPDLIIVYTGHNEFLEERSYQTTKRTPQWMMAIHERISRLHCYELLRATWRKNDDTATKPDLAAEVDALLDFQGGLEKYKRDEQWHRGVVDHFEHNLRRMIRIANAADVPIMLANPVSNLRDSPPFKSVVDESLSDEERKQFNQLWEKAKNSEWTNLDDKLQLVKSVLEIDDRFPDAHFLLAKIYEAQDDIVNAKAAYIRAKDLDICPLRIVSELQNAIGVVADQTGTPLVDIKKQFEEMEEDGIPGDKTLIDHVHPRIDGHQQIAEAFLREMVRRKLVRLSEGWKARQQELYKQRFATLEPAYFPQSVERLRGLKRWAEGRVRRIRGDSSDEQPHQE